jgi:3-dehydroquinate synthetase/shikimate kinase
VAKVGPATRSLVFIGFMGAGKSTAARAVAGALGVDAADTDARVEAEIGMPIARFFDAHGEAAFREREAQVVCDLLDRDDPPAAVALGGGALTSERVRAALDRHVVVLIDVDLENAWARARGGREERPLARDRGRFAALYAQRRPVYDAAADAVLIGSERDLARRALPALLALRDAAPPGTKLVWAHSASGEYPVLFGRGLLASGFWPRDAFGLREDSAPYLVTDETVGALHAAPLPSGRGELRIAPGEEHKTLRTAERVWHSLARDGMTRGDHVIALGGGVVGDVAGFCAATYQRGIGVVHVPTTVVAQVDSAYGGKTGIDLLEGKNYVGAYHQPAAVVVDPATLGTLPDEELAAGWAEVVKTGLLAGGPLWERVRAGELDDGVVFDCARFKLSVVAEDERDGGRRQVLNLGHTVGHAIETATGYARYRHGEAVGLGLLAALRLSGLDDLRAEVAGLLERWGLPTRLDGVPAAEVVALTARDKKRVGEEPVPFVLLRAPGEPEWGRRVEPADLRAAVTELAA